MLDKDKLSEQDCHDLYEKYLNNGHDRETYQKAGDQINATLQDVSGILQNVKMTTSEFTGTLQGATEKFGDVDVPENVKNYWQPSLLKHKEWFSIMKN